PVLWSGPWSQLRPGGAAPRSPGQRAPAPARARPYRAAATAPALWLSSPPAPGGVPPAPPPPGPAWRVPSHAARCHTRSSAGTPAWLPASPGPRIARRVPRYHAGADTGGTPRDGWRRDYRDDLEPGPGSGPPDSAAPPALESRDTRASGPLSSGTARRAPDRGGVPGRAASSGQ